MSSEEPFAPDYPPAPLTECEIHTKVEELFQDPNKWTSAAYARDEQGESCAILAPEAICWCWAGAIYKVQGIEAPLMGYEGLHNAFAHGDAYARAVDPMAVLRSITALNDKGGYDAVMKAVATLKEEACGKDEQGEQDAAEVTAANDIPEAQF